MAFITLNGILIVSGVLFSIFVAIFLFFQIKFRHWKKLGVQEPWKASFPYGHFRGLNREKPSALIADDMYNATKNEKFIGIYLFTSPLLLIRDLELTKDILIRDFSHFHDRGFELDSEHEPLADHLFALSGKKWRNLRVKLTPIFTTGKMKMMFTTLIDVGHELEKVLLQATNEPEVEVKEILARYTTDVIASCAFGIDNNSLQDPENEFRKMGKQLNKPTLRQIILGILYICFPETMKKVPIPVTPPHINNFFIGLVRDTMKHREENKIERNDFMQLLLQLKNIGYIKDVDKTDAEQEEDSSSAQSFTLEKAAAQAFLFFFAGYETTSSTLQFALYELAIDPDLQARAQAEVDQIKKIHDGQITYEAINEMHLLERIILETLRKYTVAAALIRECTKEYTIPGTTMKLQKGTKIWIPVYSFHHDSTYYQDPDKFDPDRFLPEEKEKRPQMCYLPFGEGPRNCIGNRFAMIQAKTALAIILSSFQISPSKKTPIPMVFDPKTDFLTPKGLMHLKISQRVSNKDSK